MERCVHSFLFLFFGLSQGVEVVKERHDSAERLLKRVVDEATGTAAEGVRKAELIWVS